MVGELSGGVGLAEAVGYFRQHGGIPSLPIGKKTLGEVGAAVPQVGALTRVGDDVEQEAVVTDLEIFVVAVPVGPLCVGLVAPEQLAGDWRPLVSQHRQQADAVGRVV